MWRGWAASRTTNSASPRLAADLDRIAKAAGPTAHVVTLSGPQASREHLQQTLGDIADQAHADDVLVMTLVGHGSFDGTQYKFNLPGPDVSAEQLAIWCDRVSATRQLIINTTSASGGAVKALQRHDRVVIAATKAGTEKNATVFARYWVEALQDPGADTDKNQVITALEAFQYATRKTAAFYETEKRLATEHAVFEEGGRAEPVRDAAADGGAGRMLASFALVRLGGGVRGQLPIRPSSHCSNRRNSWSRRSTCSSTSAPPWRRRTTGRN